jgi:peptidoglycan/LPS O-acetylase OafA/YrhL
VIAAAAQPDSPFLGRVLSWRPLRVVGLVSYGAYLYHLPVMAWLTPARTHLHGVTLLGLQLGVVAVLSGLSFVLVEKPVRRTDAPPAQLATLALGALSVTLLAIYVGTSHTRVL